MTKTPATKITAEDLYARIAGELIEAMSNADALGRWQMPWDITRGLPRNAKTHKAYRGINTLLLLSNGGSSWWATYKQWAEMGAQVRRGEHGIRLVKWVEVEDRKAAPLADGSLPTRLVATTFVVFGAHQVDDAPAFCTEVPNRPPVARDAALDAWVVATGIRVRLGGAAAFYSITNDDVTVPSPEAFGDPVDFYATICHELAHATGAKHRLDRQFGARFGDSAYAVEELVAELSAAFTLGALGVTSTPRPDHAQYLAHWVRVLREEPSIIRTVASAAQAATTWLMDAAAATEESSEETAEAA